MSDESPRRFRLANHLRLRNAGDFERIYALRQRAGDNHLFIFAAKNDLPFARFGLSVSRKHGNAVRRHRLKRLMREAFRLSQHELPAGFDFILIPRQGTAAGVNDFARSLRRLSAKLARRIGC